MRITRSLVAVALGATALSCLGAVPALAAPGGKPAAHRAEAAQDHVILLSVDGMHQADLAGYVAAHPASNLARLVKGGTEYTNALTTNPSDSFPGMVAQVTGGNPGTTGVYYDDSWNTGVFPAGTTHCSGAPTGGEVGYMEAADRDPSRLDAGQGLAGLPGSILQMTSKPQTLLNPAALAVDPATCRPIYPHSYLQVNTIFEVAHAAGLRTAWSDKHPAYDILNGPSGTGIDDLFTPEINSDAVGYSGDWTKDNAATQQYDGYKVRAVLNEIDGLDHSGAQSTGVPAVFGMNFQSVSTAQKLPSSDGLKGGYLPGGKQPGPLLAKALDFVDASVGTMMDEVKAQHLQGHTTFILSAKHGQSPMDPNALRRVADGPIIDGINAAWRAAHPASGDLVLWGSDDDAMLLWLSDHSQAAKDFVKAFLLSHTGSGTDVSGAKITVPSSGLKEVLDTDASVAAAFNGPVNSRQPDIDGVAQHGVVFTGGTGKIAEHGGADAEDRNVPLVISGPGSKHGVSGASVETTQIAPTILTLLGLDPNQLAAVRSEGTASLVK